MIMVRVTPILMSRGNEGDPVRKAKPVQPMREEENQETLML